MKISDYIVKELKKNKVQTVFGYTGGSIADLIDSIYLSEIEFIENYNEQASSFAANSYAQVTGEVGVAIASGGPGACNLINGIANAYYDSIPCIFMTGNVHTKTTKESEKIRQNGFQETDIVSIVSDITKFAVKIDKPEDIRFYLEKAFYIAKEGRKGPVLLDIPYDIARCDVDVDSLKGYIAPNGNVYDEFNALQIVNLLKNAKKPLILLGGGARSNECKSKIKELLAKVEIPVVASLLGLDVLPHNHKCFEGFIGHYGNRYANLAVANCDLLIVIGSRLDERQIGGDKSKFAPNAKIIHVDIDKIELGRIVNEDISINSSAEIFVKEFLKENYSGCDYSKWFSVISKWKERYPSYSSNSEEVNANDFLHKVSEYFADDAIICADVGQNQMCCAQALRLDNQRKFLNSAGFGSMGYSLPAAIGASYANKNADILSINGDGGLQMNIQELQTIVREQLPIHIILLNNQCLGMIRRLQEKMFDNRTFASVEGFNSPDYEKIANAYSIKYLKIDSVEKYEQIKDFINVKYPTIIELSLCQNMQNNPEPGKSIDRQTPLLSEDEYNLIQQESAL